MSTASDHTLDSTAIPPEVLEDMNAVAAAVAAGRKPAPDLLARVRERSRLASDAVYRRCGVLDIAVDLIRRTRDGE